MVSTPALPPHPSPEPATCTYVVSTPAPPPRPSPEPATCTHVVGTPAPPPHPSPEPATCTHMVGTPAPPPHPSPEPTICTHVLGISTILPQQPFKTTLVNTIAKVLPSDATLHQFDLLRNKAKGKHQCCRHLADLSLKVKLSLLSKHKELLRIVNQYTCDEEKLGHIQRIVLYILRMLYIS